MSATLLKRKNHELQLAYDLEQMKKIEYHLLEAKKTNSLIEAKENIQYALRILDLECLSFYERVNPYKKS